MLRIKVISEFDNKCPQLFRLIRVTASMTLCLIGRFLFPSNLLRISLVFLPKIKQMEIKTYHAINGAQFQDLVADLFNARENTNTYIISGRSGQFQGGVDIFSGEKRTAIECKYKSLTQGTKKVRESLKTELRSSISNAIFYGEIKFDHFILVSTYSHDKVLQDYALELKEKENYPFTISYIGWDEIQKWLFQYPHILERYFGNIHGAKVELVGVNMADNCSWVPYPSTLNAFKDTLSEKCPFPIFDFSFVNHLSKTIVLRSIRLRKKDLQSGLTGIPHASLLEPLCKYIFRFNSSLGENILLANPPITVPPGQAFRFQVEVSLSYLDEDHAPDNRCIFYFAFDFNSDITVIAPDILINTKTDDDFLQLSVAD